MSRSSRNPITVSISLQYFKSKKNMHFIVTNKNGLSRLYKCLMKTTIIESHCIDKA